MSRRKRRGYKQLIAKREQISRLITQASIDPQLPLSEKTSTALALGSVEPQAVLSESVRSSKIARSTASELWRTLVSSVVVVAILVSLIIVNQRSGVLTQFGNRLYTGLELNN